MANDCDLSAGKNAAGKIWLVTGPNMAGKSTFLKTVGASTALAALSQFFPLKTATDVFAQGGAIEKKDLKVGFIPIIAAAGRREPT